MITIALLNQKGGTGKTTTAVNLAASLARLGQRICLLDLDPQANATIHLGVDPTALSRSTYDLLMTPAIGPRDCLHEVTEHLSLIPARIQLSAAELELVARMGREHILRNKLTRLEDTDVVVIDCPPSLGMLSINALCACDMVIIPVQAEYFALEGLSQLLHTIELVRTNLGRPIRIGGILLTQYDARKTLSRQVLDRVKEFEAPVFETVIRDNVRLAEAPATGLDIFRYNPDCYGAQDYLALAKEAFQ